MLKARLLLFIGIWVAILPYTGFPLFLKNILFSVTGLCIVYISFVTYKNFKLKNLKSKPKFDNFSENTNHNNEN